MKKKLCALLLGLAMVFSLTGCLGNFYTTVMTVEGVEISAGLYLMLQTTAYSEAEAFLEEGQDDVMKIKIEGQSAKSWIRERTEEYCRRYAAVQILGKEYGAKISDEGRTEMESNLQYWEYFADYYLQNGIGYESWRYQMENTYLDNALFETLFGEGGQMAHPAEESKAAYGEKYFHLRYFSIPSSAIAAEDEEEAPDVTAQVRAALDTMLQRLENGTSFEELAAEDLLPLYTLMNRSFDVETAEDYIYTSYVSKESEYYDEDWLAETEAAPIGTMGIYEGESTYMLYEKIELFEDEEQWEENETTVLNNLYTDEYDEWLESIYNAYTVSKVPGAVWYYSPSKIS